MIKNAIRLITLTFLFSACFKSKISPDEQKMLITETVFKEFDIEFINNTSGKYSKINYLDGSAELKYTFEGYAKDSTYLYISNIINFLSEKQQAEKTYETERVFIKLGKLMNAEFVPIEGFHFGDQTDLYLWLTDKQPSGNLFRFQSNKICYYLLIGGIYFETGYEWEIFFQEHVSLDQFNF